MVGKFLKPKPKVHCYKSRGTNENEGFCTNGEVYVNEQYVTYITVLEELVHYMSIC
jgi:hypothetical protein